MVVCEISGLVVYVNLQFQEIHRSTDMASDILPKDGGIQWIFHIDDDFPCNFD